jgi:predicted pyridoxine 5'-phosphate oxidase superfamily flavin-nucleotide-binding protein
MITEPIQSMLKNNKYVFVATVNAVGQPHLAISDRVIVSKNDLLIFENLFCPTTLQNVSSNNRVAVVTVLSDSGKGFQLLGTVVRSMKVAMTDGGEAGVALPVSPQVLTRFMVKVESVLEFTSGIHTDIPICNQ